MRLAVTAIILLLTGVSIYSQNNTDISLFFNKDSTKYLNEVSSETGDLFNYLGHHGPAIEIKQELLISTLKQRLA